MESEQDKAKRLIEESKGKSLQEMKDLPKGTIIHSTGTLTEGIKSGDVAIVDSGDKSAESLKAEASGSDGTHALSNETPGKNLAAAGEIIREKVHTVSGSHLMTVAEKEEYLKKLKDVDDAQKGRNLGDIPVKDPYWAVRNSVDEFLSSLSA